MSSYNIEERTALLSQQARDILKSHDEIERSVQRLRRECGAYERQLTTLLTNALSKRTQVPKENVFVDVDALASDFCDGLKSGWSPEAWVRTNSCRDHENRLMVASKKLARELGIRIRVERWATR